MNLINGEIITDTNKFKSIFLDKENWQQDPLDSYALFESLKKISKELLKKGELYKNLETELKLRGDIIDSEINFSMRALIDFISVDNLRLKLKREFNTEYPFELKRISLRENNFESWYPRGVLVHIMPSNSPLLSVLGLIEGLLSGNVNVLKLSRKESSFSILFFKALIELDLSNTLIDYIIIGQISSKDKDFLKLFLSRADVVSAWGSEESLKGIKEQLNPGTKIIEWGHKISFCYFSNLSSSDDEQIKNLSIEICNNEQRACSSPQCVFIEDANFDKLCEFAQKLARQLDITSKTINRVYPDKAEQAEITIVKEQVRLESYLGTSQLIESQDRSWRILIDMNAGLSASPLFRTIWVKPLKKNEIIKTLRPLRQYLQTVGLAAGQYEAQELIGTFFKAGVQRIRSIGEMTESYIGEPHDGIYALKEFCQRISYSDNRSMNSISSIEFNKTKRNVYKNKIMTKLDFQNTKVDDKYSDLFFQSGGSSGEPKLSIFTYDDYHRQMEVAAEGLYAAGLDPAQDRCMNLFYAGNLYGGFVSFFTILEKMEAVHFPMGASTEFENVGEIIIKNRVNTLLGMPSYLMQLFSKNKNIFKEYSGIKKIFYGGEHMSLAQKNYLMKEFGVESVRSASYGSVDAGPLGFQCIYSKGSEHHLHEKLHHLEVVDLENDSPVNDGETGRFLFTSLVRHGQSLNRYEIGDVGKILIGDCPCGRKGKRFELLGRHGDVFRVGTIFLSYQKFQKILMDYFEFEGAFQIQIYPAPLNGLEKIELWIEDIINVENENKLRSIFIEKYFELEEVVVKDLVLKFEVGIKKRSDLMFNSKTGKLKSVIDQRVK